MPRINQIISNSLGVKFELEDEEVTSSKIAPGAIGPSQLDPSLLNTAVNNPVVEAKFVQIDGHLAEKADQVSLNATNANVGLKANQSDLNTTNSYLAANTNAINANTVAITNIGNASPFGAYATLSALQTAYPTGRLGIAAVAADGKWYYWNGTAWTAGGTYQATGISDYSVTQEKLGTDLSNKIDNGVFWQDGAALLDYEASYAYTTITSGSQYRMINKPLLGGIIQSLAIDTTSTTVGVAVFRKNVDGTFSIVSNTLLTTTSGYNIYPVNIPLDEPGLYIAISGLIKYQQFTGTIPSKSYKFYDSVPLGSNVSPTLNPMDMNFRFSLTGVSKSQNAIQLALDMNTPTPGQRDAFDVSWQQLTLTDFLNPASTSQSNPGFKIPNKTFDKQTITQLDINAFGTTPFYVAVIKKINTTQYQVLSKTLITLQTGLHSYDVSIEIPEDGLYLGFDGQEYYETGIQNAVNYQMLQTGSYNTGDIFTPTLNTSYFSLHVRTISTKPTANTIEVDAKIKDLSSRLADESTSLNGRIDLLNGNIGQGGTYLVIGDSISVNTTHATTFYHSILASKYGFTVVNKAIDATGWLAAQSNNVAGAGLSLKGRLASGALDGLSFDFLTIFYGTNDWGVTDSLGTSGSAPLGTISDAITTLSIYGGIKYCLQTLISKYPTKGIGVISPIPRSTGADTANGKGVTLNQIVQAIKECCELYDVNFIDIFNQSRLRPTNATNSAFYFTDGLHMNNTGHQGVARQLDRWITTL